ncbi:MAG TPA: hypothetical protein PLW65_16475 [Pseudomonadota bacterium]|nr:hypothetical protein [Pseudomonadota bacterium]
MANQQAARPRALVRYLFRAVYKTGFFLLTVFFLAPAQALQMTPRIERPEKKNRIVQVDPRK